jgi:hypothetical protein
MYVDDGVTDRRHRERMMDPLINFSGVWSCFWDTDIDQFAEMMVGVQYAQEYEINSDGRKNARELAQMRRLEEEELNSAQVS